MATQGQERQEKLDKSLTIIGSALSNLAATVIVAFLTMGAEAFILFILMKYCNLYELTFVQSIGIVTIVHLLRNSKDTPKKDKDDDREGK